MHSRIGSGRVRHLDVRWLWAQEAVQAGQFTLKKVGTTGKVSDLTTKYHDEERMVALMRIGGLRLTRGLQLAALVATLVAGESRAVAATEIKGTQATELDDNILRLDRWIACLVMFGSWHVARSWRAPEDAQGRSSLRDLRPGGPMISNPHEH